MPLSNLSSATASPAASFPDLPPPPAGCGREISAVRALMRLGPQPLADALRAAATQTIVQPAA